MPGIWNINKGYNINTRKSSSKLTFEVGEKFTGRIVDKGNGKDVTIKLIDGLQFIAEVNGKVNLDDIKLIKFKVENFENGKLKLKVINEKNFQNNIDDEDENFQELVEKEGLSKEDLELLKKMIKHNFSLSKENINNIKTIIQFSEKIQCNQDQLDTFIEKYILSKGVDINSDQGKTMKEILTKFISEFKKMSEDDILTFIENNIEFTKDNIESFNKLFKENSSIEKILLSIKEKLNEADIELNKSDIDINVKDIKIGDNTKQLIEDGKIDKNFINKDVFSKVYSENNPSNNKINVLEILKILACESSIEEENPLDKSIMDKLKDKNIFESINDIVKDDLLSDDKPRTQASSLIEFRKKSTVEEILSKAEGKEIKLTDVEFKKITEIVQNKEKLEKININEKTNINENNKSNIQKENTEIFDLKNKNLSQENSFILKISEKIKHAPDQLDTFIEKYLLSKGVDINNDQGKALKQILTKFISEFKNMSEDDILTFIENNIEFTKDNIESFNKLFKEDSSIEKILLSIKEKFNEANIELNKSDININVKDIDINVKDIKIGDNTNQLIEDEKIDKNFINKDVFSKVYSDNNPSNNKINVLEILKTLANDSSVEKENSLDKPIMDKLKDKNIFESIKDVINDNVFNDDKPRTKASSVIEFTKKPIVEEILSKAEGKEIKLTDVEFKKITEIVQNKENLEKININEKTSINENNKSDILKENSSMHLKKSENINSFENIINDENRVDDIKNEIKSKIDNVKDIVKELLANTSIEDSISGKITNLIKENINDIRVFNSISNEYYCLNFDISGQMNNYPCKLIIKDNRKKGKKIDTTNTKMVLSVKTSNLGEVDGYLTMREKRIDVNLKCDDKYKTILNNHKKELINGLATLGIYATVKVDTKEQSADIVNVRGFFNDITISAIDIKV